MNRFVIVCAARSGSTMLRHMLDDHPLIRCEGEIFVPRGITRLFSSDRRRFGLSADYHEFGTCFKKNDIGAFLNRYILTSDDVNTMSVGFKFKTDEFFHAGFREVSSFIVDDTSLKIIHLKRKDLLAQYISYINVQRNNGPTAIFDSEQSAPRYNRLKVDTSHLLKYLKLQSLREKEIRVRLEHHQILETWYEAIIKSGSSQVTDIQKYLEVPPQSLNAKTIKIIKDSYDLILNKEEVSEMMRSSMYRERFDLKKFNQD